MNIKNELQANKGEWSELYVLFKIFDDRLIPAAGPDLQPLPNQNYTFLKVLREEIPGLCYEYNLEKENEVKIINPDGKLVKIINSSNLGPKTKKIFHAIKDASSSSFVLDDIEELMKDYLLNKVKANSSQKTDLLAVIPDKVGAQNSELGFSVKSHVGGAPSLVNSSSHTNFVYQVTGYSGDISDINSIEGTSKVRRRLATLKEAGATLKLKAISSPTFHANLRLADTSFPAMMSYMLLDYYGGEGSSWSVLSKKLGIYEGIDVNEIEAKNILKNFLRAAALGMVPSKPWDTKLSAYGGYIVVLNDGQIVCYHLLNDDEFREYLFTNTKLDTPSTTRYKFADLYEEDGKLMLNLNLLIRFIK